MGMFSEISASFEAKEYKKIIKKAIETNNKDIIKFTLDNILSSYLSAKSEAWEKLEVDYKAIL